MAVIALAVIGIAAMQFNTMGKSQNEAASTQVGDTIMVPGTPTSVPEPTESTESTLKDGAYEAMGNYISPAGPESIQVSVTLEDGIITDAEVEPQAVHETSKKMQASFKEGFRELVVGKPITEVKLSKVSASSLTSGGFNEALQKIIEEAGS
jgi:uncharacterized protein with FMN-binding domain